MVMSLDIEVSFNLFYLFKIKLIKIKIIKYRFKLTLFRKILILAISLNIIAKNIPEIGANKKACL